jgi:hypothetical protein
VLGLILVFVGLKMAWLNEAFDGKLTITWSLGIILSILAIAASLLFGALGPSRPWAFPSETLTHRFRP